MKKLFLILTMFILVTSLASAQENKQNLIEYAVPTFTGIDAGALSNVFITIGNVQSLKLEKDEDDEDRNTTFTVKGNILEIRHTTYEKNLNNEKIYITCPNLNYIKASGTSRIKSQNTIKSDVLNITASGASKFEMDIDVQTLKTDISGAAKLTLKGNAAQHKANLSGAANMNTKELTVLKMEINGSGLAKADVNVKNELFGEMTGVSSIKYENKPDTVNLSNQNKDYWIQYSDSSINQNKDNWFANTHKEKAHKGRDTTKIHILGNERSSFGNIDLIIDENGDFLWTKHHKGKPYNHRFRGHWAGFELAFNGYVNKDFGRSIPSQYEFLELNDVKSVGVNLNIFELNANIINNRFGVVSGIGIQWNNYRFTDNVVLLPDSGRIYGYHNTAINSYIKSKLVESWIRVPVFLEYQTAKRHWKQFHIAVGGVFGYKIGSHSKQVHFEGGDRNKDKVYSDFYLNPIKLDAEVRIGWGPINLFASYAITPMFKKDKGPELYPYMIGITLASW